MQGYRVIMCGPAQPSGDLFWPIPGLGTAYYETQVLQAGTFVKAIAEGKQPDTDFAHGYRIQEIMETMLASAQSGQWTPVSYRLQAITGSADVRENLSWKLGFCHWGL